MPSFNIGQVGGLLRNLQGQANRLIDKDFYAGFQRAGVPLRRLAEARTGVNPLSKKEIAKAISSLWKKSGNITIAPPN